MLKSFNKISLSINYHFLIILVSAYITLCLNHSFYEVFDRLARGANFGYLVWVKYFIYTAILALAFEILSVRLSVKYILSFIVLLSSVCGFYMESLGVVFDEDIIQSVFETHFGEALDMVSFGLVVHVLIFGVLPCVGVFYTQLKRPTLMRALRQKLVCMLALLALVGGSYMLVGKDIVFVFKSKSQKSLENILNPISPIRSLVQYWQHSKEQDFQHILVAQDAKLADSTPPQVVVFFIGESARSANFSLNGYARETNPYTESIRDRAKSGGADSEALISFKNFYSCGVITAISVPCMLTHYTRETYVHRNLSLYVNNILDIAQSVGYDVWYLGNNSGRCVGGCDRNIHHKIFYPSDSVDGVMLSDMKDIIKKARHNKQNTFIIVHGYGSHGASYASRYPKEFERFLPVCKQKELSKCTSTEIVNAYDNSLLYTDWVLAQIVEVLQEDLAQSPMRSMLWYVSDHGESLGEYGQYMHGGLGYTLAPEVQKHIPSILWFSKGWGELPRLAKAREDKNLSHDYIFHTLLHILGVQTRDYDKNLDIFSE